MKSVNQNLNIHKLMEDFQVTGLSMAEIDRGQIKNTGCFGVLEKGTDRRVESDSIFNACSISKFLTSILVMKLTEQGVLDLDEDVNNRLSSWRVPYNELNENNTVTLRNLLSHQSGVMDPEGSFTEFNTSSGYPNIVKVLEGTTSFCKEPIEIKYKPESDFHYSDAGFCIIQVLIEDVMKKPFQDVMNKLIFQPLHMKESTYKLPLSKEAKKNVSCGHDKRGKVVTGRYPIYPYPAASGLWTTPTDLASLVIELMRSLRGESKLKLSRKHALEVITPQGCKEWTGLGVFLDKNEEGLEISSLGWGIGFQCMLVAYPEAESGLVVMTNTDLGTHQLKGIIGEVYRAFL